MIAAAALSAVVILYFAITYKSISSLISDAKSAEAKGDTVAAERLMLAAIEKDPASEDAFRMLAALAEKKSDYVAAAYLWERLSALNPISDEYVEKMFAAISAAGMDDFCISKYESLASQKKLPDWIKYAAGASYVRTSDAKKYEPILASLETGGSPYAGILKAQIFLKSGDTKAAENSFKSAIGSKKDRDAVSTAQFGTAFCALIEGDTEKAASIVEQIGNPPLPAMADIYLLKYNIALLKQDTKTALDNLKMARKIRRQNVGLTLECAELALSLNDSDSIKEMRADLKVKNKSALMLDYYLAALESAAKGENLKAMENLQLTDRGLQSRSAARALAFHLACRLKRPTDAADALEKMAALPMPEKARELALSEMAVLLSEAEAKRDYTVMARLSEAAIKADPKNVRALRYVLNSRLAKGDYPSALSFAQTIDSIQPGDRQAYEASLIAMDGLNRSAQLLKAVEEFAKSNAMDSFTAVYAARAARKSGDAKTAVKYYLEASKDSKLPEAVKIEAGGYLAGNADEEDFNTFFHALSSDGKPEHAAMALTFKAEFLAFKGDIPGSRENFRQAMAASPKSEAVYGEAAYLEYAQNDKAAAIAVLEKGLEEIPQSAALNFRLALILSEDMTPQNAEKVKRLLGSAVPQGGNAAYAYAALSKACAVLNEKDAAMGYALKAETADRSNPEALLELGVRLFESGQFGRSFSTLLRIQDISANERAKTALINSFEKTAEKAGAAYRKKLATDVLNAVPGNENAKAVLDKAEAELRQSDDKN